MKWMSWIGALALVLLPLAACRSAQGSPGAGPPAAAPTPAAAPSPSVTREPPPPAAAAVPLQPTYVSSAPRPYLEILKLQQAGAPEEQLLEKIRAGNLRYELSTAEILELRQAGVSEAVVEAMLRSGR